MEQEKLNEIIASHGRWLQDEGGKRADLRGAYLRKADLRKADLYEADLRGTNLRGADLRGADLRGADLRGAYLRGADLHEADLRGADLEGATLPIGVYQVVGAGSCNRCTTYDSINDRIVCGCWDDSAGNHLDSFARRIEEIYGTNGEIPNQTYYAEYMAGISFFKAMKELKENHDRQRNHQPGGGKYMTNAEIMAKRMFAVAKGLRE